ncbi:MAG: GNAT family protein [Anaerolineales bacterium]|jgi:RimJ/RimL family protein N-acetyltransferase
MPLQGKMTILREEREEDMPFLLELRNNLETQGFTKSLPTDYTLPMYTKRFESREFSFDRGDGRFVIVHKDSSELAGSIGYVNHEPRHAATIGIAVSRKFWGTGLAYDAQEVLLNFLFHELGLRVVRLWTNSGNPAAVDLAGRSGFKVSVRGREAVFRLGAVYDNLMMDLLREEFYQARPELKDNLPSL